MTNHTVSPEWRRTTALIISPQRNLIEQFFRKLTQFRRIATRHHTSSVTFFAVIQFAVVKICLRSIEPTA